jgi:hypothetical protein
VAGCCECGDEPSGSCATELLLLLLLSRVTGFLSSMVLLPLSQW